MGENSDNQMSALNSHLGLRDTLRVGISGLSTRKLRATLSAIGITLGIATVVSILGLSQSGSADLIKELDALGTNLLIVQAGQGFKESNPHLPPNAAAMIRRISPVSEVATVSNVAGGVYRNDLINEGRTRGITIFASDLNLLEVQRGTLQEGMFLSEVTSEFPFVVLGYVAAERLGIREVSTEQVVWFGNSIGGEWFTVIGILDPLILAADLDRGAIIGYGSAQTYLRHDPVAEVVYVRADPDHILDVRSVMAATVNPEYPDEVQVSRASDVLEARIATKIAFVNLFLGLGAVALLVGGIGIANIMVISVMERRNEIGLRRALGATRFHIATQFISESLLLSGIGGIAGIILGVLVTALYATIRDWSIVVPVHVVLGGIIASVLIGVAAGFHPALRAAKMSPTDALRTN